jgi:hypothetical protein
MPQSCRIVIVSVGTPAERDMYIRRIYTSLTSEPSLTFTIVQERINKIQVFHNVSPEIKVLIRVYIVVIIPVMVDIKVLKEFTGNLTFHLDETINSLYNLIHSLERLQGSHTVKPSKNSPAILEGLLKSLT